MRGLASVVIIFLRQCLEIVSTEVELFVLDKLSCSVDFSLCSGKANFRAVAKEENFRRS